jgi:hypothetical protein
VVNSAYVSAAKARTWRRDAVSRSILRAPVAELIRVTSLGALAYQFARGEATRLAELHPDAEEAA